MKNNTVSVCIATYNGIDYLKEQLESILYQLSPCDEIIISDDGSNDGTVELIDLFKAKDKRIKFFQGPKEGLIKNFENAINHSIGGFVFLSDQDDIWIDGKVTTMKSALLKNHLVVSDCFVIGKDELVIYDSFFANNGSRKGVVKNLIKNSYLGCCMAFRREILELALPFPKTIPMHDWWLGLVAESFYNTSFINTKLLKYRRHGNNASPTGEKSTTTLGAKFIYRLNLIKPILRLSFIKWRG